MDNDDYNTCETRKPEGAAAMSDYDDDSDEKDDVINQTEGSRKHSTLISNAEKQPTIVVVGIYIGAKVCGSAFCYNKNGNWSAFQMNKNWESEYGIKTTTIPTAMAWNKTRKSSVFGHDALTTFIKTSDPKKYVLFETQSLTFKKNRTDTSNPNTNYFLEVAVRNLKENIEKQLQTMKLLSKNSDVPITWIVTHADIMKYDITKEFLHKIIGSRNIDIISEDKAAAVWCAEMPIYELVDMADPSLKAGTYYCVVDAESQYLSMFKKKGTMSVDMLATLSITLDLPSKYEKLFSEVFDRDGKKTIARYKKEHCRDWFIILKDMQTQIIGFVNSRPMSIDLALPISFITFFGHITEHDTNSVRFTRKKSLLIKPAYFDEIFDSCASKILYFLEGLNNSYSYPLSFVFLIGKANLLGRPISRYMHQNQSTFPKVTIKEIKEPEDSGACALKGAILIGRKLAPK